MNCNETLCNGNKLTMLFMHCIHLGGTQRLPRLVGLSKAKELIFTGKALKGADAVRYGVVDYSVPPNEAGDAAYQRALLLANEILPQGPVALRAAKRAINEGIQVSREADCQGPEIFVIPFSQ